MEKRITYQRLRKPFKEKFDMAYKYYSLLSVLNSLSLTERELQLIAFSAVRGSPSYATVRDEFCKKYDTTVATINNMTSKLKKLGIFVKEEGKTRIARVIALDFENDVKLEIFLEHGKIKDT